MIGVFSSIWDCIEEEVVEKEKKSLSLCFLVAEFLETDSLSFSFPSFCPPPPFTYSVRFVRSVGRRKVAVG